MYPYVLIIKHDAIFSICIIKEYYDNNNNKSTTAFIINFNVFIDVIIISEQQVLI